MDRCGLWTLVDRLPSEGGLEVWNAIGEDGTRARLRRLPGPVLLSQSEQDAFVENVARVRDVKHPALLTVRDGGEDDNDFYVVTAAPPLGALSLLAVRQRARPAGGLTVGQVLHMGVELAGALQALHEQDGFHGALDASSVFVDEAGSVLLGRTGAAVIVREDKNEPFGVADDVRRLGALLWEALVDRRLLFGTPEPPSSLRSDIPTNVDAALVRALAEQPAQRFHTAAAFGEALARSLASLEGKSASSDVRSLVSNMAPASASSGGASASQVAPPAPRVVDVPIFAAEPRRGLSPAVVVVAAIGVLGTMVLVFGGMIAFFALSVPEPRMPARAVPDAVTPPRASTVIELRGPAGHTERLPPYEPTVVQVWLQGCADCMPRFETVKRVRGRGELAGLPIVNVAYGQADPGWARSYGVGDRLVLDAGAAVVQPLGIGTFTSLVMYPDGTYVPVAVDEERYADSLRAALALTTGERQWTPNR